MQCILETLENKSPVAGSPRIKSWPSGPKEYKSFCVGQCSDQNINHKVVGCPRVELNSLITGCIR